LKLIKAATERLTRGQIAQARALIMERRARLSAPCPGLDHREQFRVLFLDKKNKLIADEVQERGTVDHTPVYVA
jgi:DNA repair protein RadC